MNNLQQTQIATRRDSKSNRYADDEDDKITSKPQVLKLEFPTSLQICMLAKNQRLSAWATELIKNEEGSLDNNQQ